MSPTRVRDQGTTAAVGRRGAREATLRSGARCSGLLPVLCLCACFRAGFVTAADGCAEQDCSGHGACLLVEGSPICDCDIGYEGTGELECVLGDCTDAVLHVAGRQFVQVPDAPSLDGLSALTLEAWFRLDEMRQEMHLISHHDHHEETGYVLLIKGDRGVFRLYTGEGQASAPPWENTGPLLETGRWYHLAGTYDGSNLRLFLDGLLIAQHDMASLVTADCSHPLVLGAAPYTDRFDLVGLLDEVRISSVARYSRNFLVSGPHTADAETLALWHLDDAGQQVVDETGAHHGSLGSSQAVEETDPAAVDDLCLRLRLPVPDCDRIFGDVPGYTLCEETDSSCTFFMDDFAKSCETACTQRGETCQAADGSLNHGCAVDEAASCEGKDFDKVCTCTRL